MKIDKVLSFMLFICSLMMNGSNSNLHHQACLPSAESSDISYMRLPSSSLDINTRGRLSTSQLDELNQSEDRFNGPIQQPLMMGNGLYDNRSSSAEYLATHRTSIPADAYVVPVPVSPSILTQDNRTSREKNLSESTRVSFAFLITISLIKLGADIFAMWDYCTQPQSPNAHATLPIFELTTSAANMALLGVLYQANKANL